MYLTEYDMSPDLFSLSLKTLQFSLLENIDNSIVKGIAIDVFTINRDFIFRQEMGIKQNKK